MDNQRGFTLMEMIGVMAVIAILASVATPTIIDAIRNAKITSFVEDVNGIRTVVAKFYKDTGQFPVHIPGGNNQNQKQLMKNTSNPIRGWDGPYLEKDLVNPFSKGAYRGVLSTANANYQFDLDGDGTPDTSGVSVIRLDQVSNEEAQKISEIIDGDGDITTGNNAWNRAGRVKRYGATGNHANILLIYISKT